MKLSVNLVVAALVVWAVCVTLWMMVLSARGSWTTIQCWHNAERADLSLLLPPAFQQQQYQHQIGMRNFTSLHKTTVMAETSALTPRTTTVATDTSTLSPLQIKRLRYYSNQIERRYRFLNGSHQENCTLVVVTYKRVTILSKFLNHYCKIAVLQRILIIWNEKNTSIPGTILTWARRCKKELKFIKADLNKLTNRYIPRKEIKTNCVCVMDDDRLVSVYDMQFGFEVWQNFKHLIVGFEESSFMLDSKQQYTFVQHDKQRVIGYIKNGSPQSNRIEIVNGTRILHIGNKTYVLGKVAHSKPAAANAHHYQNKPDGYSIMQAPFFVHRAYLEMFFDPLIVPPGAVKLVERLNNCEDILLSIVVTKFLGDVGRPQCGALTIKPSLSIKDIENEAISRGGPKGLSKRPGHLHQRSKCLAEFAAIYGYLPLQLSNTIATLV